MSKVDEASWGDLEAPRQIDVKVRKLGGVKHDHGKPRLELLPPEALEEIAIVMAFGASKYSDHNWREGFMWSRITGALLRHLFAFIRGEETDEESGLSHLAHAGACMLFLITHRKLNIGYDDRFKK